ncbi:hypothetical protein [Laceyella sacchari]|jgi:hypothetical protein|uniref:Uncharacterized protein n=1 Tax=Laceyella sacchari TaxID=37482 RepID=A0ABY5U3H6_LACSH|nr:hypothetical protein [Laceyella sacchari]TCW37444.1 hypothetical protein EDC32_10395 [Laceyella sacchari]UWE02613.1 hypothetical protein NYR52_10695 [Laceyella sacchari]
MKKWLSVIAVMMIFTIAMIKPSITYAAISGTLYPAEWTGTQMFTHYKHLGATKLVTLCSGGDSELVMMLRWENGSSTLVGTRTIPCDGVKYTTSWWAETGTYQFVVANNYHTIQYTIY